MLSGDVLRIGDHNHATLDVEVRHGVGPPTVVMCHAELSDDGKYWMQAPGLSLRAPCAGVFSRSAPVIGTLFRVAVECGDVSSAALVTIRVHFGTDVDPGSSPSLGT
jgi:hypothetical protein